MISLDIDGVLADWVGAVLRHAKRLGFSEFPETHAGVTTFDFVPLESFYKLEAEIGMPWATFLEHEVEPLVTEIPFDFACYVTHRQEDFDTATLNWLARCGFPDKPVIHVQDFGCKADAIRSQEAWMHLDDRGEVVTELLATDDMLPFLLDQPWNQHVSVPKPARIYSLDDLIPYARTVSTQATQS